MVVMLEVLTILVALCSRLLSWSLERIATGGASVFAVIQC